MENELLKKLEAQEAKIDAIYVSVEKTRKYFVVTLWITVIMFVLPLLGLLIIVPMFVDSFTQNMSGLI